MKHLKYGLVQSWNAAVLTIEGKQLAMFSLTKGSGKQSRRYSRPLSCEERLMAARYRVCLRPAVLQFRGDAHVLHGISRFRVTGFA